MRTALAVDSTLDTCRTARGGDVTGGRSGNISTRAPLRSIISTSVLWPTSLSRIFRGTRCGSRNTSSCAHWFSLPASPCCQLSYDLYSNFNATLMKLLYNIDVNGDDDKHLAIIDAALSGAPQGGVPGKFLIRYFPFLRFIPDFLPGAGFQKQFARWQTTANALKNVPFEHVKAFMVSDRACSTVDGRELWLTVR